MFSLPSLPANQSPWTIFLLFLPASGNLPFPEFQMKYHNICCHCKKDHLIFCGHMPYVLKEDDKYCFVTFSWQNAKGSENKDTFHTWSFKKILGKILQTKLQCATPEFYWVQKEVHGYYPTTLQQIAVHTEPWPTWHHVLWKYAWSVQWMKEDLFFPTYDEFST